MIHHGDCIEIMAQMPAESVDAIVTDPPYGLGFMGKAWDDLPPGLPWALECLRVLKPGGHLIAFGGTRTYHRLAVSIEDAGFQIRDQLAWLFGSGFPKSHNVGKAIDREAGAERQVIGEYQGASNIGRVDDGKRGYSPGTDGVAGLDLSVKVTAPATAEAAEWEGWGSALKPAHEPIVLARKPLAGTIAQNVLEHGTGGLNVDGCRIGEAGGTTGAGAAEDSAGILGDGLNGWSVAPIDAGRFPANVVLDPDAAEQLDTHAGDASPGNGATGGGQGGIWEKAQPGDGVQVGRGYTDTGGPSRFFYSAKTSRAERDAGLSDFARQVVQSGMGGDMPVDDQGADRDRFKVTAANVHPTVKPIDLMRWLVRLVTPPGGTVLDPFTGSGTTACAAVLEGFNFVGAEREAEYVAIAQARMAWWAARAAAGDTDTVQILERAGLSEKIHGVHRDAGQLGLLDEMED